MVRCPRRLSSLDDMQRVGEIRQKSQEPFITGFIQNNNYIDRPVDMMNMPDGSMLVSDDFNGAVFRVFYGTKAIAGNWSLGGRRYRFAVGPIARQIEDGGAKITFDPDRRTYFSASCGRPDREGAPFGVS